MFFWRKNSGVSWIIVFLGNPGPRYENTRHNAGFLVADALEKKLGVRINRLKYNSLTTTATIAEKRVFLMKPQTYMNLSGGPVRQAKRFYNVLITNILVISDDVALPTGKLRIRRMGSAGGHNGLKDIIQKCGSEGFPRIKIGVGAPPDEQYEMSDWVLSKLSDEDEKLVHEAADIAVDAIEIVLGTGIERAMGEYN